MDSRVGWGMTIWLGLFLPLICASARGCVNIPIVVPVLLGLGAPAALLLWLHRRHLSMLLAPRRH